MPDREKVIYDIERCICHVPDACRDCSHYGHGEVIGCMEELLTDALALLKEQEETIRNLEQEIRDKNERLKERAEQVDSMLKERKPVEPSRDIALNRRCPKCFAILKGKFCHKCGQAVKWE